MRDIVSPLDGFASPFGALRGSAAFDPASLFANDELGVWLDPSDTSTLFQDTAGTTPVTAPGQTVALALSKDKGLVLGEDVAPAFSTYGLASGTTGTFAASGDNYQFVDTAGGLTRPGVQWTGTDTLSADTFYQFDFEIIAVVGATSIRVDGITQEKVLGVGSHSIITTGADTYLRFRLEKIGTSISDGFTLGTVVVRELPGNHATQSGSSFRPQYQTAGLLFDGLDDRMITPYKPTTSGTIIAKFNGDTASRVIAGSQPASDGRCFLALDASGRLAAGIGAQSTATIYGGSDIRGEDHVGAVTWDGSTVKLYLDGTEVYSEAQSGAVNTTVDMMLGALSANGTAAAFWDGTIADHIILDRVMTPEEITKTTSLWSA